MSIAECTDDLFGRLREETDKARESTLPQRCVLVASPARVTDNVGALPAQMLEFVFLSGTLGLRDRLVQRAQSLLSGDGARERRIALIAQLAN